MDINLFLEQIDQVKLTRYIQDEKKCSITASLVVEAISGKQLLSPPCENVGEGLVNDEFQGVSYINVEKGDYGHRMAIIHNQGSHKLIHSNTLIGCADVGVDGTFTYQQFLHDNLFYDKKYHQILRDVVSTYVYLNWLEELRKNIDPKTYEEAKQFKIKVTNLIGVTVIPKAIYVCTFPATVNFYFKEMTY